MYVYFFRLSFHSVKININHLISWLNSVRTPLLSAAQGSAKLVFPPPPFANQLKCKQLLRRLRLSTTILLFFFLIIFLL